MLGHSDTPETFSPVPSFLSAFDGHRLTPVDAEANEGGSEDIESERAAILVVEDEGDAREAIIDLLEQEGFLAIGAENGARALDLLHSGRAFSLILLDLTMPVMNGWEFCEALEKEEKLADIPVAIITADANHHRLPRRRRDAGLFVKPIHFPRLLKVVHRLCD